MNAAVKTLVFDWNSTLLDDFGAMHACVNIVLGKVSHAPISADAFRRAYDVPFGTLYANLGFHASMIEQLSALDKQVFHTHYEDMAKDVPLREGAEDLLRLARQNALQSLILSNHLVDPIRTQLRRLAIDHLFDEVLAYADIATQFVDMSKGERLRRYMAAGNHASQDAVIVGDSVEEIRIAREQGMISVAITGGCGDESCLRRENPDHVIHSLRELPAILKKRGFAS